MPFTSQDSRKLRLGRFHRAVLTVPHPPLARKASLPTSCGQDLTKIQQTFASKYRSAVTDLNHILDS